MPLFQLFFGQGQAKHGDHRKRVQVAKAKEAMARASVDKSLPIRHPNRRGKLQLEMTQNEAINDLRSALTWLTGNTPYGNTNAMVFNNWAPTYDFIKAYTLSNDGKLYKGGVVVTSAMLGKERDHVVNGLYQIVSILAMANRDRIHAGRANVAGQHGSQTSEFKGRRSFPFRGRKTYSQEVWGDILKHFAVENGRGKTPVAIHYDPVRKTFDIGPYDYIQSKRAMGAAHGSVRQEFADTINKIEGLYYDYARKRLTYRGVDTDYLPYKRKEAIGKMIYQKYFHHRTNNWKQGDPYGWYNLGPRPSATPTPSPTPGPVVTPSATDGPVATTETDGDNRISEVFSKTIESSLSETRTKSRGPHSVSGTSEFTKTAGPPAPTSAFTTTAGPPAKRTDTATKTAGPPAGTSRVRTYTQQPLVITTRALTKTLDTSLSESRRRATEQSLSESKASSELASSLSKSVADSIYYSSASQFESSISFAFHELTNFWLTLSEKETLRALSEAKRISDSIRDSIQAATNERLTSEATSKFLASLDKSREDSRASEAIERALNATRLVNSFGKVLDLTESLYNALESSLRSELSDISSARSSEKSARESRHSEEVSSFDSSRSARDSKLSQEASESSVSRFNRDSAIRKELESLSTMREATRLRVLNEAAESREAARKAHEIVGDLERDLQLSRDSISREKSRDASNIKRISQEAWETYQLTLKKQKKLINEAKKLAKEGVSGADDAAKFFEQRGSIKLDSLVAEITDFNNRIWRLNKNQRNYLFDRQELFDEHLLMAVAVAFKRPNAIAPFKPFTWSKKQDSQGPILNVNPAAIALAELLTKRDNRDALNKLVDINSVLNEYRKILSVVIEGENPKKKSWVKPTPLPTKPPKPVPSFPATTDFSDDESKISESAKKLTDLVSTLKASELSKSASLATASSFRRSLDKATDESISSRILSATKEDSKQSDNLASTLSKIRATDSSIIHRLTLAATEESKSASKLDSSLSASIGRVSKTLAATRDELTRGRTQQGKLVSSLDKALRSSSDTSASRLVGTPTLNASQLKSISEATNSRLTSEASAKAIQDATDKKLSELKLSAEQQESNLKGVVSSKANAPSPATTVKTIAQILATSQPATSRYVPPRSPAKSFSGAPVISRTIIKTMLDRLNDKIQALDINEREAFILWTRRNPNFLGLDDITDANAVKWNEAYDAWQYDRAHPAMASTMTRPARTSVLHPASAESTVQSKAATAARTAAGVADSSTATKMPTQGTLSRPTGKLTSVNDTLTFTGEAPAKGTSTSVSKPVPTLPQVISQVLKSSTATKAPTARAASTPRAAATPRTGPIGGAPAPEGASTGKGTQGVGKAPLLPGNYTRREFEAGIKDRIVGLDNLEGAIKTIKDNLVSIYPQSEFYLYSVKLSSNLFKKHGLRFANGMIERLSHGVPSMDDATDASNPDRRKWVPLTKEEFVTLGKTNPSLLALIAQWSTILSAASYSQYTGNPAVYEGLFTSHPELLALVKEANADESLKARISFNVGKGRLAVEPDIVTKFRKFFAGLIPEDKEFLQKQGLIGAFPLIITDKGEYLVAKNIAKIQKGSPVHTLAYPEVKAVMGAVWDYVRNNNIVSGTTPESTFNFDRIDPTKFKPDPNAEPYEDEQWMKDRPVLDFPDKQFPELMQRPEPEQLLKDGDHKSVHDKIEHDKLEQRLAGKDAIRSNTLLLDNIHATMKSKLFGSGAEARKWFEQKGIHDITLDAAGRLAGDPHGYDDVDYTLGQIFRIDPATGKTYAEGFQSWVQGLKTQDNRPEEMSDLDHIEDLLAGHSMGTHHDHFRSHYVGDDNISKIQNSDYVAPKMRPLYGRHLMELYNEKNQFNVNPTYYKKFIYLSQLANNKLRTQKAGESLRKLTATIKVMFKNDPELAERLAETAIKGRLARHARYSNNGIGSKQAYLRDDAPPSAIEDIDRVTNDILRLQDGYPKAQADTLHKSMTRMGLSLRDVYLFAELHPDLIPTPAETGLQEYGKGLFKSYRIMERPGAIEKLKDAVKLISNHYAEIMPGRMRDAGMALDNIDQGNFVIDQMNKFHHRHLGTTHANKSSNVWAKNEEGQRGMFLFDSVDPNVPVRYFDPNTNTTRVNGTRTTNWRDILGPDIETYNLDTELVKNNSLTPAGWTFLNKYFEPIAAERSGKKSFLMRLIESFGRSTDKQQMYNTNTRQIANSRSAKISRPDASFEALKSKIIGIAKRNGIDINCILNKNGTVSILKTNYEFERNPNAQRELEQLRNAMQLTLSPKTFDKVLDVGTAEHNREEALMGVGETSRYAEMDDDRIANLPWREAVLAKYIKQSLKNNVTPELSYFDYIMNESPITHDRSGKRDADGNKLFVPNIANRIKLDNTPDIVTLFQTLFMPVKPNAAKDDPAKLAHEAYEKWLVDTKTPRKFFGELVEDADERCAPPPTATPRPKPTPGPEPKPQTSPTPKPQPTAGFKTTPTTVTPPTPTFGHPRTPNPVNMRAAMGESTVNANQPWQMGQQNANLGNAPGAATMSGLGIGPRTQQQQMPPNMNMGSAQFAQGTPQASPTPMPQATPRPTPQATPRPQATPNPFVGQQQSFTPPQQQKVTPGESEAISNAFNANNQETNTTANTEGDQDVREDTFSPDWVNEGAKEGAPSGTNQKLFRLLHWLKNKSLENLEDQHRLLNQGSPGRAMLKDAVNLVKGRPKYYDLVQDKDPEIKRKR